MKILDYKQITPKPTYQFHIELTDDDIRALARDYRYSQERTAFPRTTEKLLECILSLV